MSLTAVELGKKIKSGEVRVVDAVNAAFDQIEAVEKDINSYVTVYKKEEVLEKAEHIQKLIDEGPVSYTHLDVYKRQVNRFTSLP